MLDNLTPFAAEILPGHGADGTLCSTVVIKATLDFEGRAVAQGNAVPVFRGDEFFGAEGPMGVVRHEADIAPLKSRVDVLFNGYAYAPGGKPAAHFDAGLAVGGESRVIRVFGKRVWRRRLGVLPLAQEVEPALKVPVTYNLAFGERMPKSRRYSTEPIRSERASVQDCPRRASPCISSNGLTIRFALQSTGFRRPASAA